MTVKRNENLIISVDPGSPAAQAGIREGDILLTVGGRPVEDVFDYRMRTAGERVRMRLRRGGDGQEYGAVIEKAEYHDAGLEFERPLMDEAKSCRNKCVFCFIDQLPQDMRGTLYFKDDDYRLSFLEGNYITLTNMTPEEARRVVKYRLSPINISLHTTDPELRITMMHNKNAGSVMEYIKLFIDNRITLNFQIVLCRGINDGARLDRTLADLTALGEGVNSISAVPVGLTSHRAGLPELKPFDGAAAREVLDQIRSWQRRMKAERGTALIYPADEFYILAGEPLPKYKDYEGFPQLENGVGMITLFEREFSRELARQLRSREATRDSLAGGRHVSVVTGGLARGFISELAERVSAEFPGELTVDVFGIENRYFGEKITVSGLLTGRDIIAQLKDKPLGSELLLPRNLLRAGENMLLDNVTTDDISTALSRKVRAVPQNGAEFVKALTGRTK